jgi:hypothetical protein
MNFSSWDRRIACRRHLKQSTNIVPKLVAKLVVAAFAGGLMLGSGFALEAGAPLPESAPALCEVANALVREGKPGPAILAYERAQQLAPRDPAIAANLQAARDSADLVAPPAAWWQSAARALTMNEWAWSGSLALALVCGALSFHRWFPARLRQPVNALSAAGAVVVLVATGALWLRWPELSRAVVVKAHVTALIAPAESAGPVFPLAEGEIVTAKKALRNFVLVRTANGRSGWVARTQIERVIPAPVPDRAG